MDLIVFEKSELEILIRNIIGGEISEIELKNNQQENISTNIPLIEI